MSLRTAKKLRSNSGVQPPMNAKRPKRSKATGLSNLLDLLSTKQPTKSTGKKQTILQASIAIKPTKELPKLLSSSPNELTPLSNSNLMIFSFPKKPYKVESTV